MEGTHFKNPAPGGSIKRQVINPDLLEERAKCTFDQDEIKQILFVPEVEAKYDEVAADMRKYPELIPSHKYFELTREEQMEHDWRIFKRQVEISPKRYIFEQNSNFYAGHIMPGIGGLALHFGMFLVCVQKLATDEQNRSWDTDIKTLRKIGCYA